MADIVLECVGLTKHFGGIAATDAVSLDVRAGEIHAVIGPNGAGKTTLISQLSGETVSEEGRIRFLGQDITRLPAHRRSILGLARSFQITSIFLDMPVITNVALAVQAHRGHSFRFWRPASSDPELTVPAEAVLAATGLAGRRGTPARALSHGEQRQLEIAMALATEPTLLLLDEPMAGMGPEESGRMVETLKKFKGDKAILLIEHDMDAVFALADRITVLVYGRVIASGSVAEIRANEDVKRAYLGEETA
ncbi:MAG: ABC transporter ATP-binding protein [Hyphomicrobiales bacterium]|nr:ABC transporter ATP-binding protein [Hyphomicrobiales bacterium]